MDETIAMFRSELRARGPSHSGERSSRGASMPPCVAPFNELTSMVVLLFRPSRNISKLEERLLSPLPSGSPRPEA
eukprot:5466031-Prymnesium_polylepis.1